MTDSQIWRRFFVAGALFAGLQLTACTTDGFTDDGPKDTSLENVDGGFAKSMLIGMGAIDDPHPMNTPKFQPRPTLVVPPTTNLPPPQDDSQVAKANFPVDPEVREENERRARLSSNGTPLRANSDGSPMTLAEQEKFRNLPKAQGYAPNNNTDYERRRPLRPDEMDGKAQAEALKQAEMSGSAKSKQQSLLMPPEAYRTPSDKAPLETPPTGLAAMKPSWWPF